MDVEAVTSSIKQLILGSGKFMQEANTLEQAEERISRLEENDDQFHKYDFVKLLKTEIEHCIGPMVHEEIERHAESGHENVADTDTLVARISDKVTRSQQLESLKTDVSKAVQESVDRLLENFEEEFREGTKGDSPDSPKQRDPYQLSDEESMLSGSYNHGEFLFVTLAQLQKNIEDLDKKNSLQTRKAALNDLLHMSLNDVLTTNDRNYQREWGYLERGIIDALSEQEDDALQRKALMFISRGIASSHGNSRELYSTLTTFLYEYFTTHKNSATKVKNGLDASKHEFSNILVAFRLMNDFQKYIPNFWVRYPTQFLNEVLERSLSLLSLNGHAGMSVQPSMNITPVHYIALLDPMAEWFMRWTHGCYSRFPLFTFMKKQKAFLENLVRSILEFVASRKVPFDLVSEASESLGSQRGTIGSQQQRFTYTGDELEYYYFVHALNIVGRILMYKQGLRLFPIKVKGYEEEITITKLICTICQLVTNSAGHGSATRNIAAIYEPSSLATDILKKLCSSESTYQVCMCKDEVTGALLMPVAHWLDSSVPEGALAGDAVLLNISEILSMMASRSTGRKHLLYGEKGDTFSRTSTSSISMEIETSSAAHCFTDFCKKSLSLTLPSIHGQATKQVAGAYLFLCRQLYNNGEGLQAIYSYDLHNILSNVWREAAKSVANIKMDKRSRLDDERLRWEETVRDNLLSFSTTPKGVLLMQQSTAMEACVEYLCQRHQQRMQVSIIEKFGYGSIITQIAGTACGMLELGKQGLINALCADAWNSIEPGEEFEIPFQPKIWSVEPIDKSSHKPLVNLLHIFSNFTSVFELIGGERLVSRGDYTFRDKPSTLLDLLNRIAIINTAEEDAKIHFLFNFEQSHVFGLRLLNALIACLDTLLLLDSQFKLVDTLISSQSAEDISNEGETVLDLLSVERNHILARAMVIGGPSERVLPSQSLPPNRASTFPFPLIKSSTLPKEYLPNIAGKSSIKQVRGKGAETELSRFLSESKSAKMDASWIEKCKVVFCKSVDGKTDSTKSNVLLDVLERTVTAKSGISTAAIFTASVSDSENAFKSYKLTTLQEYGVRQSVRYGVHLKLLASTHESQESLTKLLRHTGAYLKQQQRQVGSHLRSLNSNYVGFDWFAASVFLMMRGSYERSWRFLQSFSTLAASAYLWGPRMHRSIHLPANLASSSIPPVLFAACHNIELLLQVELPLVYPAFRMSGFTASQICQLWIRQCFWNYLDWSEICHYIVLCTLLGVDYQVYMCVAILKHLQHHILYHQQQQDLVIFLREQPITGFKIGKNLEYMKRLESKYRKTVLPDLLNLSKP